MKAQRIDCLLWLQGCAVGSSTERTRTTITNSLKKKLADLMSEFTALRNNIVNQYRDVVDRRCASVALPFVVAM